MPTGLGPRSERLRDGVAVPRIGIVLVERHVEAVRKQRDARPANELMVDMMPDGQRCVDARRGRKEIPRAHQPHHLLVPSRLVRTHVAKDRRLGWIVGCAIAPGNPVGAVQDVKVHRRGTQSLHRRDILCATHGDRIARPTPSIA